MGRRYAILLTCMAFVSNVLLADSFNNITRIFCYKGLISDKIVLYFSEDPTCNRLSTNIDNNTKKMVFFLPKAKITDKNFDRIIRSLNSNVVVASNNKLQQEKFYKIDIKEVNAPIKGVKILITYDLNKIAFSYDVFDSIGMKKGLSLNFCKQDLIEILKNKGDPIKTYAFNDEKKNIIIDFGHGGEDLGAVGCYGLKEKDINFDVGFKVAQILKKNGCRVFLTRNADFFLPLDHRVNMVNNFKTASILVSIHSNFALNEKASGLETFYLKPGLIKEEFTDLNKGKKEFLIKRFTKKSEKSLFLAEKIQESILNTMAENKIDLVDRKVKSKVAQILLGADCPSVLVELGFLSNKKEAALLKDDKYQLLLAQGIVKGISYYFDH